MKVNHISIIILITILLASCRGPSDDELSARIAASDVLSHVDKFCMEFPKPRGFRQIKKGLSGNSEITIIYYQYVSDMSFSEVKNFYLNSSNRAEYVLVKEDYREPEDYINLLTFLREDIKIVLEQRPPSAIYSFDCIK